MSHTPPPPPVTLLPNDTGMMGDRVGPRSGGYLDNRGMRDRERGLAAGGRPGGIAGGAGVGIGAGGGVGTGRGSLLDEFRSSIGKNRKWELQDLRGEAVEAV